ncbi:hypothetical protein [Mariprofundus ferrooxydans]|uniref:Uncharacterized protein n=1 Tax=Mariprofundus ferrooxydans PV-1 TaxID=314345 RepID=Q0F3K7_9PROT|nr:hypothetical protein [Mariprofundus ferrooxydans]EAU55934.1 hypothetical protein SPV1_03918 [Mariprofundus ferrooxydans PV-1]KON48209.1 hypothetical protein AL013_04020 [Mariprofundus ferrooxydans]
MKKEIEQRLTELEKRVRLLKGASSRYLIGQDSAEIMHIGALLRSLVGKGDGNGLLFDLANHFGKEFTVYKLDQIGSMNIKEVTPEGEVVQDVTRRAIIFTFPEPLPIISAKYHAPPQYSETSLDEWVNEGFLLDWEAPKEDGSTPEMVPFTPLRLIHRYAAIEGSHSDGGYGVFKAPIESYTLNDVPVVHTFLLHIALVVLEESQKFLADMGR